MKGIDQKRYIPLRLIIRDNMDTLSVFLIFVIIGGILGIIYVVNYNKLQYLKTKIEQSENIIDEALRDKYDTIVKINTLI